MRIQSIRVAVLVAVVLQVMGCGALRAASARQDYINSRTQDYVYNRSIDQVWSVARQMLFEQGYAVRDTGEGGSFSAETEWKQEGKERSRYLLTGMRVDDGHSRVQFTRAEETQRGGNWENDGSNRDFNVEFELIKRVEPDAAQQIESEADVEGEKARG